MRKEQNDDHDGSTSCHLRTTDDSEVSCEAGRGKHYNRIGTDANSPGGDKDAFYSQLEGVVDSLAKKERLFALGDFPSAREGQDHDT